MLILIERIRRVFDLGTLLIVQVKMIVGAGGNLRHPDLDGVGRDQVDEEEILLIAAKTQVETIDLARLQRAPRLTNGVIRLGIGGRGGSGRWRCCT